jgi:Di-haem oxidoreductase, putative peroxidase
MKGTHSLLGLALATLAASAAAQTPPGEGPALGTNRITQADIVGGGLTLTDIRTAGLKIFATPFNKLDGYGDGAVNPADTTSPGHRPTLQNNGTFLRVNGLDGQTCMECHFMGSNATVPLTFAVGGVAGAVSNAMFQPRQIDVDDSFGNNYAFYDGRYINPPFLFGSGGVELLAKEMTTELQALKLQAMQNPGTPVLLKTKRVEFGTLVWTAGGGFDTSGVVGIDPDLVVRPFGRKGEFPTVRAFDLGAMAFHLGMQPVESVGADVDDDGDGVANEILVGEISALHVFNTNLEPPAAEVDPATLPGFTVFKRVGCADCHRPSLRTDSTVLTYSYPEVATDPAANVFYSTDLHSGPAGFELSGGGGVIVPLYSDLKRHFMGPGLAESFGAPLDPWFVTARLWGIADTAPYLHDGRATTLTEAILLHGGEAQVARDAFDALANQDKTDLLTFLRTLRTPTNPAGDIQ